MEHPIIQEIINAATIMEGETPYMLNDDGLSLYDFFKQKDANNQSFKARELFAFSGYENRALELLEFTTSSGVEWYGLAAALRNLVCGYPARGGEKIIKQWVRK